MNANPDAPRPESSAGVTGWLEQRLHLTELFSFVSHLGFVYTPVDTRRPLRDVLHDIFTRPSSSYLQWPRVLGLLSMVLLGVLAVTGILLACYYQPTRDGLFEEGQVVSHGPLKLRKMD